MKSWAPLSGTQVVEACQRLVGPFAGWHLAMLGANVAKVELPSGDIARSWAGGHMFDVINGQKLCAALDIDSPAERTTFEKLCAGADIVIADASWSEQAALAGSRQDDARTRSVVIVDDGSIPGGSGSSETLAQAAMAVTGYIGEPSGGRCDGGPGGAGGTASERRPGAAPLAHLHRSRDRLLENHPLGGAHRSGSLARLSPYRDRASARSRVSRSRRLGHARFSANPTRRVARAMRGARPSEVCRPDGRGLVQHDWHGGSRRLGATTI
jgi:CoA-transferase family III